MTRLFPKTLFAQTVLVLLAGTGLALAAGAWIYSSARQEAVRAVGALAAAERIINVSRLVGEAPAEWRRRLVEGSSDPLFQVMLTNDRPALRGEPAEPATIIAGYIKDALGGGGAVLVAVATGTGERIGQGNSFHGPGPHVGPPFGQGRGGYGNRPPMHDRMMAGPLGRAGMSWRGLDAAVEIGEGAWLRFTTSLPDTGPTMSPNLLLALGVIVGTIMLLTAWAVRRMVRPLAVLSAAATELGRNVEAPPLAMTGTLEMRRAAEAFNDMQRRLRQLIENRTLMLAAISHDLRTELTLMRLRVEAGAAGEDRDRLLEAIADMEQMLTATLSFAREEARSEERRRIDIGALVASIVDDMSDAGLPVTADAIAQSAVASCKPIALRRAITNLVDNAVKYGTRATVTLMAAADDIAVVVDDTGPGIPAAELARVTEPFYRVESSRSRETGGIGLGLAIVQSIAEAHGGTLALTNRKEGGLRATLTLPRETAATGSR